MLHLDEESVHEYWDNTKGTTTKIQAQDFEDGKHEKATMEFPERRLILANTFLDYPVIYHVRNLGRRPRLCFTLTKKLVGGEIVTL